MTYDQLRFSLGPNPLTADQLAATRESVISRSQRLAILKTKGSLWADDEILWHLGEIQQEFQTITNLACCLFDPLMITGWFNHETAFPYPLEPDIVPHAFVTANRFNCHWAPLIMVKTVSTMSVHVGLACEVTTKGPHSDPNPDCYAGLH